MAVTMDIVAIATVSGGKATCHGPIRAEVVYCIDDDAPFVYLACKKLTGGIRQSKAKDWPTNLPSLEGGLEWWQKPIMKKNELSQGRPWGHGRLDLQIPGGQIAYYLWPRRLLDFRQWDAMMLDVEAETGICPWVEDDAPHAAVENIRGDALTRCSESLDALQRELRAAAYLVEHPYVELWDDYESDSHQPPDLPENRLVSQWFRRRRRHLDETIVRLERWTQSFEAEIRGLADNTARQESLYKEHERWTALLRQALRLKVRLRRLGIMSSLSKSEGSFSLTPAMFRDHRLRTLLSALRSTPKERFSQRIALRSALPPLLAPRLFELWGAVCIVQCLRASGWEGPPPACVGPSEVGMAGGVHRARWRLKRGEYTLLLDWSLDPVIVAPSPATQRTVDALSWSASKLETAASEDGEVFATRPSTPDYIVRLSGPRGRALGIGDATLSDPRFQKTVPRDNKVEKISRYTREIGWRTTGATAVTRCAPLGLFLLLPGAVGDWSEWQKSANVLDCRLFAVTPGEGADAVAGAVIAWIHHLVWVAEPRLEQSPIMEHIDVVLDPTAHDAMMLPS